MAIGLMLIVLICFQTCQSSRAPADTTFRIVVPDSMEAWKTRIMRSYDRWSSESPFPFRLDETASRAVRVNDNRSYRGERYTVSDGKWIVDGHEMTPTQAVLFYTDHGDVRIVFPQRTGSWILFEGLGSLVTDYAEYEEALLVYQFGQLIYAAGDTAGQWVERVNVFAEREAFTRNAKDRLFTFYGKPIDFSSVRVNELLSRFRRDIVEQRLPRIYVYPDFETKARVSANLMEYSVDVDRNEIHIVDNATVRSRFEEILALYFARIQYGEKFPWLVEGLAFRMAGTYFGKTPQWWKNKYALLEIINKTELLGAPQTSQNPFLFHLMAMDFWDRVEAKPEDVLAGPARFLNAYRPTLPSGSVAQRSFRIPYYKGFCFAHSNGIQTGYTSRQSEQSLQRVKATGANFVSITPFGYSADERSPTIQFVLRNVWDETLGGLLKAAEDAHAQDMGVIMKPHLWLGNGKWCGEIDVPQSDLAAWENSYSQFIVYHALIAELSGMDALCVGVELPNMTPHTDMWKRIITRVRLAYNGPLTFGGNWFNEYDKIHFWDELDFIGVQHYFPLATSVTDSVDQARRELFKIRDTMQQLSLQWNRPIVLTEVGFPSIDGAFISPHKEDFSQRVSNERQAEGYRMLIDTFADQPWCKGFFWWKWESADRDPRDQDKSFQIRGKMAESVVRNFYHTSKRNL
jgi:hypothetical protein